MPEASLWLRAYVGVYAATLRGRKQLILFIFRSDGTTCRVHIPYVVPEVARQIEDHVGHALSRTVPLADIELRRPRSFLSLAFRASARVIVA